MFKEKRCDKILCAMGINKRTASVWRQKILTTLFADKGIDLISITESDKTFFF
jgi:hypothetical protein